MLEAGENPKVVLKLWYVGNLKYNQKGTMQVYILEDPTKERRGFENENEVGVSKDPENKLRCIAPMTHSVSVSTQPSVSHTITKKSEL